MEAAISAAAQWSGLSTVHVDVDLTLSTLVTIAKGSANVRITGPGTINTAASAGIYFAHQFDQFTEQPISPATKGAYSVTTTSPATGLSVGDYVFIYTGNTTAAGWALGAPDSEINKVAAVSGSTVTLEWPLCKNYVQEYFNVGQDKTSGTTSPSYVGTAAPLALRKIVPSENITFDNLTIDHRGSSAWMGGDLVVDLDCHDITATCKGGFHSMSAWTGGMDNMAIHVENEHAQWFAVAYGSRDTHLRDSTLTADTLGQFHSTEGASKLTVERVTVTNASGATGTTTAVLSFRGRGYDIALTDVTMTNAGTYGGIYIDAGISGTAAGFAYSGTGALVRNSSTQFTINGTPGPQSVG